MKAIIMAAGSTPLISPHTDHGPLCMVELHGRSILEHQVDAYRANGIEDITVIVGSQYGTIDHPGTRVLLHDDDDHESGLMGLFSAGTYLTGEVVVSYGHIVFGPEMVSSLLHDHACASLAVDRGWHDVYLDCSEGGIDRTDLCETTPGELVTRVGRGLSAHKVMGQFIGLARFSSSLTARLWALYLRALANGTEHLYGEAANLGEVRLTDMINAAIDQNVLMRAIPIRGGWREINSAQNLQRARLAEFW